MFSFNLARLDAYLKVKESASSLERPRKLHLKLSHFNVNTTALHLHSIYTYLACKVFLQPSESFSNSCPLEILP